MIASQVNPGMASTGGDLYRLVGSPPPRLGSTEADGWPGARLSSVPAEDGMPALVDQVCAWWGVSDPFGFDPEAVFAALGWPVVSESLGASKGSHRAMLIPRLGGGFTAVVDPGLTPEEAANGAHPGTVRRARLAHELAHSFFYTDGAPPRRLLRLTPSEERACDSFAASLSQSGEPNWLGDNSRPERVYSS